MALWLERPGAGAAGETETDADPTTVPVVDAGGCDHYRNRCELLAPCCGLYFRCHLCHNEAREHACGLLDRSAVRTVRCASCRLAQGPAERCERCRVPFAERVCLECSLYRQDDPRGLFHCPDCGICRVGKGLGEGGSHWHCASCCACLPNSIDRASHGRFCRADASKQECSICFEDMHQSRSECVIGPYCGHFLHKPCFEAYLKSGKVKCPLCQKPLLDASKVYLAERLARWLQVALEAAHAMTLCLVLRFLGEGAAWTRNALCATFFVLRARVMLRPDGVEEWVLKLGMSATLTVYFCLLRGVRGYSSLVGNRAPAMTSGSCYQKCIAPAGSTENNFKLHKDAHGFLCRPQREQGMAGVKVGDEGGGAQSPQRHQSGGTTTAVGE